MATIIRIKVTPNASQNQMLDWKEGVLSIRIRGVPEKGQVNKELVAFLSIELGIPKSQIELISGHTSRLKRLKIEGITKEYIDEILQRKGMSR